MAMARSSLFRLDLFRFVLVELVVFYRAWMVVEREAAVVPEREGASEGRKARLLSELLESVPRASRSNAQCRNAGVKAAGKLCWDAD